MNRQTIVLADAKNQDIEDIEGYLHDTKDDLIPSTHISSAGYGPAESASPARSFVKWALLCTLMILAMTFTSELLERPGIKASPSIKKLVLVTC